MEQFRENIENVLQNHDRERTVLLRFYDGLKVRQEQNISSDKSYAIFIVGALVGAGIVELVKGLV